MSAVTDAPLEADDTDNEFELLDDAIGTTSGRTSKFDIGDVTKAAKMIDESHVVERVVAWRQKDRAGKHPGGRPQLSTTALSSSSCYCSRASTPVRQGNG
jgi:hypothetical protein